VSGGLGAKKGISVLKYRNENMLNVKGNIKGTE
jgi:hypothetical protein